MLSEIDGKKFWIYFVLFVVSLFLIISTGIFLSLENLNKTLAQNYGKTFKNTIKQT